MQEDVVEAELARRLGIDVQWVAVTAEAINRGLLWTDHVDVHAVGCALRIVGRCGATRSAEPAGAQHHRLRTGAEQDAPGVRSHSSHLDGGVFSLVENPGHLGRHRDLAGRTDRAVQSQALRGVHDRERSEIQCGAEIFDGPPVGDQGEGRQHCGAAMLVEQRHLLGRPRSDAERVQHHVRVGPGERRRAQWGANQRIRENHTTSG